MQIFSYIFPCISILISIKCLYFSVLPWYFPVSPRPSAVPIFAGRSNEDLERQGLLTSIVDSALRWDSSSEKIENRGKRFRRTMNNSSKVSPLRVMTLRFFSLLFGPQLALFNRNRFWNAFVQEAVLENDGWSTNNIKRDVFYEEWVFISLYSSILYLEIVYI